MKRIEIYDTALAADDSMKIYVITLICLLLKILISPKYFQYIHLKYSNMVQM